MITIPARLKVPVDHYHIEIRCDNYYLPDAIVRDSQRGIEIYKMRVELVERKFKFPKIFEGDYITAFSNGTFVNRNLCTDQKCLKHLVRSQNLHSI